MPDENDFVPMQPLLQDFRKLNTAWTISDGQLILGSGQHSLRDLVPDNGCLSGDDCTAGDYGLGLHNVDSS